MTTTLNPSSFSLLVNKFEKTINIMLKNKKKNINIYWNRLTILNNIFKKHKNIYKNNSYYDDWNKYFKETLKQRN